MALPKTDSDYVREISDLELRLDLKDSYISILEHQIKSFQSIKLSDDQEFLDKAAIAAMQSIIITNGDFYGGHNEKCYEIANDMLTERKRLQRIDNENN